MNCPRPRWVTTRCPPSTIPAYSAGVLLFSVLGSHLLYSLLSNVKPCIKRHCPATTISHASKGSVGALTHLRHEGARFTVTRCVNYRLVQAKPPGFCQPQMPPATEVFECHIPLVSYKPTCSAGGKKMVMKASLDVIEVCIITSIWLFQDLKLIIILTLIQSKKLKCCALVRLDVFWPLVAVWEWKFYMIVSSRPSVPFFLVSYYTAAHSSSTSSQ